jgi:tetratricopeptide (TPR) repeat protein
VDRAWTQYQLGLIRASYDPAQAIELLRAAEPTYGASVTNLLPFLAAAAEPVQVGVALAKVDQWEYAELAFSQSAESLASAYRGLARDMQSKDGARWIDQAVALAPENPQVRFLQGLHLRLNYDYAGSLQAIIQAVALDPENPALYAELGRAYQLTGDLVTAERWLQFAISLDANFQPVLNSFYNDEANTLLSLGLIDEAAFPFSATPTPEP